MSDTQPPKPAEKKWRRDKAPNGLPIYELGDPEAPYGISAYGGGYMIVRPPDVGVLGESEKP